MLNRISVLPAIALLAASTNAAPPPTDLTGRPDPAAQTFMTIQAPDSRRENALRHDLGDEAVQSWKVDLSFDALTAIEAPDGIRLATARGIPISGLHLDLPIPGRSSALQLNLDTVYEGYGGVITYAGVIDGDDGSLVAISVDGDEILGKIHHSEGFTYLIESALDGPEYTLSVIDQTEMMQPKNDHDGHDRALGDGEAARPGTGKDDPVQPMSSGGEVRLLIMYTPAAAQQTSIQLLANNIVSSFNQSLSLSGVSGTNFVTLAELRVLGTNFTTTGDRCRDHILDRMQQRTGAFQHLDAWMEVAYADIGLAIVTTEPGYTSDCGSLGRIGGKATFITHYPDHQQPFAMTTDTYALGDLTAAHEIGHVLNGAHNAHAHCTYQGGNIPNFACGYAPSHCDWQTMMGGYVSCSFDPLEPPSQQPTVRIARWSNPNVNYNGEPTGVGGSYPYARNMVAALNVNMPHAAGWKGTQATPPSAPNPISAHTFYCFGQNAVQWTAQSGAVEYRLFQSHSPSFTSPFLVYSGPGTGTLVNVNSTAYLRARACNSGGCSPYSQQVTAHYQSWCS